MYLRLLTICVRPCYFYFLKSVAILLNQFDHSISFSRLIENIWCILIATSGWKNVIFAEITDAAH